MELGGVAQFFQASPKVFAVLGTHDSIAHQLEIYMSVAGRHCSFVA
jgi:hypothetical protein